MRTRENRTLRIDIERFDLQQTFRISTGSIDYLIVLKVEIREGDFVGRGECIPSAAHMVDATGGLQYAADAAEQVRSIATEIERGASRHALLQLLPSGPPRNAVDCALWDLEAKRTGCTVIDQLELGAAGLITTATTIGLNDPGKMGRSASKLGDGKLLKLKLGGDQDIACVAAVRDAAPDSTIIVDVNCGWTFDQLGDTAQALSSLGVALIEQPLPVGEDDSLDTANNCIPLCADESCFDRRDIPYVEGRYEFINIKLDKCGGLTEALAMIEIAKELGIGLMVGCMSGTSLSMVPAGVVGHHCRYVDLDGPLLLREDRQPSLHYRDGCVDMHRPDIWG